jgi:Helicase HerA, central domain
MTFKIPAGVLAQHVIALGKTGAGKSSALRVLVEGLLDADDPVCIVDPKGDWWGIKSSADGRRAGYPLVIFGGEHADVPINEHSGSAIAELIATGNRSCLIDLGGWMVGERTRFFIAFASTLFKLTRGARHLVIDGVHNFAPQGKILDPDAGKMLHWSNRLASEGRGKGITILAASQRPQKVHKDFVTSCETLIAMRVIHKLDRDSIKDWIDGCADPAKGREVLGTLAQMKRGEAWIWSPEIEYGPERIAFPMFKTYDSFKPQAADAGKLAGWANVDLDQVKTKLAKVVEEAKANDPAALKKRIAELEKAAREGVWQKPAPPVDTTSLEHHCYAQGQQNIVDQLEVYYGSLDSWLSGAPRPPVFKLGGTPMLHRAPISYTVHPPGPKSPATERAIREVVKRASKAMNGHAPASDLPKGEIAVLSACIQYPDGLRREQITVLTGFKRSTRDAYIYRLKEKGFVEVNGETVTATEDGMLALPNAEPLPRGRELQQFWLAKLPQGERLILEQLIEAYPDPLARDELTTRTGFKRSTRDAYLYRMASKQIVTETSRGNVRASEDLF